MKILYVLPAFDIGGMENLVIKYMEKARENKIDAKLIVLNNYVENMNSRFLIDNGYDIQFISKDDKIGKRIKAFRNIIRDYVPTVIHIHGVSAKFLLLASKFKRNKKINYFLTIHNEPEKDAVNPINKFFNKVYIKMFRVNVFVLSKELKAKTEAYYKIKNAIILYNGIDFERFKSPDLNKSSHIKREFEVQEPSNSYLHIGRFSAQKNHCFLIDIFEVIQQRRANSKLYLIGSGERLNQIKLYVKSKQLENNIVFVGNSSDIVEWFHLCDTLIFPSLYEGMPIVLIEAQASGIRTFYSNTIDPEIMFNTDTFSLPLDQGVEIWASKILSSGDYDRSFGFNKKYDIESIFKLLINVYASNQ